MIILVGNFAPVTYPMDEIGKQKLALCSWCVARPPHRLNGAHFYFYKMKDKFNALYATITKALDDLNGKKITVEHAKAVASLSKQANNTIATQLDASKFLANIKDATEHLEKTGLFENENNS